MRVLVIEDEIAIANVLRRGLERANYTVDHFANGTKGLAAATERSYAADTARCYAAGYRWMAHLRDATRPSNQHADPDADRTRCSR